jgi:hypothetical protein
LCLGSLLKIDFPLGVVVCVCNPRGRRIKASLGYIVTPYKNTWEGEHGTNTVYTCM